MAMISIRMHMPSTRNRRVLLALSWYDHRLHRGVAAIAARFGWQLDCPTLAPGWQAVPRGWRGDGAISLLSGSDQLRRLRRACPMVVDIGLAPGLDLSRTVVDNAAIARLAFVHFRERGYSNLAVLSPVGVPMFEERVASFLAAARMAGCNCTRIAPAQSAGRDAWRRDAGLLGRQLAALPHPLAVYAVQDSIGALAIRAADAAGLAVPGDVAVLGSDDQELICTALPVPLASVDSDQEGLGRAAAERLANMLAGRPDDGRLRRHPPRAVTVRASAEALGTTHPGLRMALERARMDPACGVRTLAMTAGFSPQGLDKACRRELGEAPGALLRRLRLEAAQRALAGGAGLVDAARSAGLSSSGALCGLFRRSLGTSPGAWASASASPTTGSERPPGTVRPRRRRLPG
jgi:LacI family transcriptional regulator